MTGRGSSPHHHGIPDQVRDCRKLPARERDDCYFELMSVATFMAGLNFTVVDMKWPTIREAFRGFSVDAVASLGPREIERIENDPGVIRSKRKIAGVVQNARAMQQLRKEHGGMAQWLDSIPDPETRVKELHRRFAFMGPSTAYYFLHYAGEPLPAHRPEMRGRGRAGGSHGGTGTERG